MDSSRHSAEAAVNACLADELVRCPLVIGYAALPGEPNIDSALDACAASGKQVLLPVVAQERSLRFGHLQGPMSELPRAGALGIREPAAQFSVADVLARISAESSSGSPATLLVPGLAFDARGARLGQGGGYYDRAFGPQSQKAAALERARDAGLRRIGVCFADECVEHIDVQPWDLRVDALVTEDGLCMFT